MNLIVKRKLFIAFVIFFIVKFNYLVLGQDSTDNSGDGGSDASSGIGTVKSIPEAIIENIIADIDSGDNSSSIITRTFSELLGAVADRIKIIFPGTEWCGSGDVANNTNDLGYFDESDECCRNHDTCPGFLAAGESNGTLINDGIFTRSTCECDNAFHQCLKDVNSTVSTAIGETYFNLLRPQCYADYYPIVSCARNDSVRLVNKKCVEYIFNTSEPRILEWIDNPDF